MNIKDMLGSIRKNVNNNPESVEMPKLEIKQVKVEEIPEQKPELKSELINENLVIQSVKDEPEVYTEDISAFEKGMKGDKVVRNEMWAGIKGKNVNLIAESKSEPKNEFKPERGNKQYYSEDAIHYSMKHMIDKLKMYHFDIPEIKEIMYKLNRDVLNKLASLIMMIDVSRENFNNQKYLYNYFLNAQKGNVLNNIVFDKMIKDTERGFVITNVVFDKARQDYKIDSISNYLVSSNYQNEGKRKWQEIVELLKKYKTSYSFDGKSDTGRIINGLAIPLFKKCLKKNINLRIEAMLDLLEIEKTTYIRVLARDEFNFEYLLITK